MSNHPTEGAPGADTRRLSIEWHPDALRPSFDWRIQLPPDWAVVETHPTRWKRQNERIVDDYFEGRRVPSRVRNALLRALGDAVALAQQKKVLLTLIKPGVDDDGRVSNISLNLVFSSSSPRLASMAPIKRAFGSKDGYSELTAPTGNAYAINTVHQKQRDGKETRDVVSVQAFYPFPGTQWTLAIGATTPRLELEDRVRDMVIRCASSVRLESDAVDAESAAEVESYSAEDEFALVDHIVAD